MNFYYTKSGKKVTNRSWKEHREIQDKISRNEREVKFEGRVYKLKK